MVRKSMALDSSIKRLSVVVSPRSKDIVAFAFAGSSVGLDLDTTDRLKCRNIIFCVNFMVKSCLECQGFFSPGK